MKKQTKRALKIVDIAEEPLEKLPYITAVSKGVGISYEWLPVYWGEMLELPEELDAIIIASDLQGIAGHNRETIEEAPKLLGEELAEVLSLLFQIHLPDLDPAKVMVCLCGDLYTDLTKRGASGNPLSVWRAFQSQFGFVTGIAGNHDLLTNKEKVELDSTSGIHYFSDGGTITYANLAVAGLGGIIGRSDKPNRMGEADYLAILRDILRHVPDILLLHESPKISSQCLPGNPHIWNELQNAAELLVCCGHVHWGTPLVETNDRLQILNADGRAFIFTAATLN
ncbi:metallophosphoesterase family protein [Lysinibacillus sp. NPDC093692]|uniref:metallophosphoesterase family protein n=1 Tax=Lysinibacillus sp. NPDC093692 TaxID=3390578 RepID=UPI003CFF8C59